MYIGKLERFGYTLQVVSKTKRGCVDALMKTYEENYGFYEGEDPHTEHTYSDEQSDYDIAKDEIYIEEIILDKVCWD